MSSDEYRAVRFLITMPTGAKHLLDTIANSSLAVAIRDTLSVIALLSGLHVVGMTFVVGSALVLALQLTGGVLPGVAPEAARRIVVRVLVLALSVSVATGILMALPRANDILDIPTFQRKMTLLGAAIAAHALVRWLPPRGALRVVAASHFVLWGAVAVYGAMFTLLE
jgi:hypothetical protein